VWSAGGAKSGGSRTAWQRLGDELHSGNELDVCDSIMSLGRGRHCGIGIQQASLPSCAKVWRRPGREHHRAPGNQHGRRRAERLPFPPATNRVVLLGLDQQTKTAAVSSGAQERDRAMNTASASGLERVVKGAVLSGHAGETKATTALRYERETKAAAVSELGVEIKPG
jgi:hypothetical protein